MLGQFKLFAEYNRLMNDRLFDAASSLPKELLHEDRGAFFKSVIGTLNHILVGDIIWLKRFSTHPSGEKALSYLSSLERPKSLNSMLYTNLHTLRDERVRLDNTIIRWIQSLSDTDIQVTISYKNMEGILFTKELSSLISHLFLHQVHHRGQVTTLLSQYGVDFGDTDLIEIIDECQT